MKSWNVSQPIVQIQPFQVTKLCLKTSLSSSLTLMWVVCNLELLIIDPRGERMTVSDWCCYFQSLNNEVSLIQNENDKNVATFDTLEEQLVVFFIFIERSGTIVAEQVGSLIKIMVSFVFAIKKSLPVYLKCFILCPKELISWFIRLVLFQMRTGC